MGFVFALRTGVVGMIGADRNGCRRIARSNGIAAAGTIASRAGLDVMPQKIAVVALGITERKSGAGAVGRRYADRARRGGRGGVDGDGIARGDKVRFMAHLVLQL